jgi:hypothetical protein
MVRSQFGCAEFGVEVCVSGIEFMMFNERVHSVQVQMYYFGSRHYVGGSPLVGSSNLNLAQVCMIALGSSIGEVHASKN